MTDPIREAAEKVVAELDEWHGRGGPHPDPVAALVVFADAVIAAHCHCPGTPVTHFSDCQPGGRSFKDWEDRR